MEEFMEKLYENVYLFRKLKRLREEDLADLCGLHKEDIEKIEHGEIDLEYSLMKKIANALGISLLQLQGYEESKLTHRINMLSQMERTKLFSDLAFAEVHFGSK